MVTQNVFVLAQLHESGEAERDCAAWLQAFWTGAYAAQACSRGQLLPMRHSHMTLIYVHARLYRWALWEQFTRVCLSVCVSVLVPCSHHYKGVRATNDSVRSPVKQFHTSLCMLSTVVELWSCIWNQGSSVLSVVCTYMCKCYCVPFILLLKHDGRLVSALTIFAYLVFVVFCSFASVASFPTPPRISYSAVCVQLASWSRSLQLNESSFSEYTCVYL